MNKTHFESKYVSKEPDSQGYIYYTPEENQIWAELIEKQLRVIKGKACEDFMKGLDELDLPLYRIPQLYEINEIMMGKTGWKLKSVPALISFEEFFGLLAQKIFPVATFIRNREDFEYLQEPDLFHELFGHCPMLLNQEFADFTEAFGKIALRADPYERDFLGRLYWFTAEFGLIESEKGLKIYGGGILSSPSETLLSIASTSVHRESFNILNMLRTPYRIDRVQPIYFKIKNLGQLMSIVNSRIFKWIQKAEKLGLFEPMHA